MPQSFSQIYVHIVFSTKNRYPFIETHLRDELYSYIGGIIKGLECHPIIIGGYVDHVHVLMSILRSKSVSDIVREIKSESSRWMKAKYKVPFQWQSGYAAFSVGFQGVEPLKTYISNQPEHHRHKTFQEEYIDFLRAYGIDYDPRYMWD